MNTMEEGLLFEKRDELNHPGVIVLRVADLETIDIPRLDNPSLLEACKFVGISLDVLKELLKSIPSFNGQELENPEKFPFLDNQGNKEEDVILWKVVLPGIGLTEVSVNTLYPPAVKDRDNITLHLTTNGASEKGDFEIIYCREGGFTLAFPMSVDPLALGVYVASPERNVISFSPGTLVFIKAPHPNGWEAVTREPCQFTYICNPLWDPQIAKRAVDA